MLAMLFIGPLFDYFKMHFIIRMYKQKLFIKHSIDNHIWCADVEYIIRLFDWSFNMKRLMHFQATHNFIRQHNHQCIPNVL